MVNETDEDIDEIEIVDAEEYDYDIEDILNDDINECLKCNGKTTSGYAVCRGCFKIFTITKTNAIKEYKLKLTDLNGMNTKTYKNMYGTYTTLYFLKEIRLKAIEKRFNIINPTKIEYINSINILRNEYIEKQEINKKRAKKILATKIKNKKEKERIEKEKYKKRKSILKKELSKFKLVIEDIGLCNQYLDGHDISIKDIVAATKRKHKLEKKLQKHNLEIRSDSYYCNQYIEKGKFKIQDVVDMMVIMNFYINKTQYNQLIRNYLQQQYQEAKEYGYWDGHRIELDEDEKDKIKKEALKLYLKNNSKKSVPNVIIEKYG